MIGEAIIDAGDKVFVAMHYHGRGRLSGVAIDQWVFEVLKLSKPPGCRSRRSRHQPQPDRPRRGGADFTLRVPTRARGAGGRWSRKRKREQ